MKSTEKTAKRLKLMPVACWQGGPGGHGPPSWQFLGGAEMKTGRRFRRILKVGGKKRI
jgi:hypothetical protein